MKFGQNLKDYSVPQWANYNLDYDNVKKLIKQATSDEAVQAIKIPGQESEDALHEGIETDLYGAFREEHERIELYCKTKYGEIQRRLEHNTRLLDKMNARRTQPSLRRRQKLEKLEQGVSYAGNDLQLLSRFIGANRLGFFKLLKKYKKWGGSARLIQKFRREQLDSSEFFSERTPLTDLLAQYSELLEDIRARLEAKSGSPTSSSINANKTAHDLQHAFQDGTQAEFDSLFCSLPTSENGGRAVYWIHQDNLLQVHVLLRTKTSQRRASATDLPTSPLRATSSPLNTFGDDWCGSGMIICGNLEAFSPEITHTTPPARIFYTTSDKAVSLKLSEETILLRRKEVALLLQTDYRLPNEPGNKAFNTARKWFDSHQHVKPLAEVGYVRTTFAGVSNTKSQGLWATLDNDIVLAKLGDERSRDRFPHAILDVRWEGKPIPEIVRKLDQGVAERIPDFDLITHTIATTCPGTVRAEWLSILQQDLRKNSIAAGEQAILSVRSKSSSKTTASDRPSTGFSAAQDQSSATSANESSGLGELIRKNKREALQQRLHVGAPLEANPPGIRYWNEFDDGDEDVRVQDRYEVEVYPDEWEDAGVAMFTALGEKLKKIRIGIRRKMGFTAETRPLLGSEDSSSSTGSDEDEVETAQQNGYSTFATHGELQARTLTEERAVLSRQRVLFWLTWITYAVSLAFLTMSIVLESIGRKKYSTEVRVFSVFGTLMSFVMALIGLICGLLQGGKVARAIMILSFLVVCIADGLLVVSIWGGSG